MSTKLSATSKAWVPSSLRGYPELPLSQKSLQRLAEKALAEAQKSTHQRPSYVAVAEVPPPQQTRPMIQDRMTYVATAEMPRIPADTLDPEEDHPNPPSAQDLPNVQLPALGLFRTAPSQSAQERWKERWMLAAAAKREAGGQSGECLGKGAVAQKGSDSSVWSGWHAVLLPAAPLARIEDYQSEGEEAGEVIVAESSTQNYTSSLALNLDLLRAAILRDDCPTVQRLLNGQSVTVTADDQGPVSEDNQLPPVMLAVTLGRDDILQLLLENSFFGGGLDVRDRVGKKSALLLAAEYGKIDQVKLLVKHGGGLESKDRLGDTILHKAVRSGNASLVSWLCGLGEKKTIKLNARNKKRETPLLLATTREVAAVLLAAGADASAVNADGFTIQCLAARSGHARLLEYILVHTRRRGDGDLTSSCVTTPLHQAALNGNLECLRVLLMSGAGSNDINTLDASGMTPLHIAVVGGRVQVVEMMLHHGSASPTAEDFQGANSLVLAAFYGQRECLSVLSRHACQPHRLNSHGETTLETLFRLMHSAVSFGQGRGEEKQLPVVVGIGAAYYSDDKRRVIVARVLENAEVFIDLICMGCVLTDRCIRRLVPLESAPFFKELQSMFENPAAAFSFSVHGAQRATAADAFLDDVDVHPPRLLPRLTFFGLSPPPVPVPVPVPQSPPLRHEFVMIDPGCDNEDLSFDVGITFRVCEPGGEIARFCCLAHKSVVSSSPRLAAMIRFCEQQAQEQSSESPRLELHFEGDAVKKAAFFELLRFLYKGHVVVADDASGEEVLLELLWVADESLCSDLSSHAEQLLLKRLVSSTQALMSSTAKVYFRAGSALGLVSLRLASAYALLRAEAVAGSQRRARDELLGLVEMEDRELILEALRSVVEEQHLACC